MATKHFTSMSVPLADFIAEHPELGESVIKRNGVKPRDVGKLHVSFLHCRTSYSRSVATVLLTTSPVELEIAGIGSSIKNPVDSDVPEIGVNIALARAVRDAVS